MGVLAIVWFQLKPDFLITFGTRPFIVLDTKWKQIWEIQDNTREKYGLSQSDFYQLLAYGEKYLNGQGDMYLIYPKHEGFTEALPAFIYKEGLRLWTLPFDLETERVILPDEQSEIYKVLPGDSSLFSEAV